MRTRLLPAALGLVLLVSGSMVLAGPAHATPVPVPAPVEITSPVSALAFEGISGSDGQFYADHALQRFVSATSGPLESLTSRFTIATPGARAELYADDQVSIGPNAALAQFDGNLYLGQPLSSTTIAANGAGTYTTGFSPTVNVVEGNVYWVLINGTGGAKPNIAGQLSNVRGGGYDSHVGYGPLNGYFAIDVNVTLMPVGVTLDPSTPDGSAGWYTSPVTATYTCTDAVDSCPAPATVTADGEPTTLSGTVTLSEASSSFAWFHTVKIDRTAPTITGTAAPHGTGFRVTWTCEDATSGVATCPEPVVVSGAGDDTVATAVASDAAGNTATGAVTGLVGSAHAPTLTISGVTPGKTYAYGAKVTPTCATTGTRPSAPTLAVPTITCTGTSTAKNNADGSVTWTYTATAVDTDPLGGTTTKSVSWRIAAKPVPVVQPAPKPGPTKKKVATVVVKGLPKATKNGHAVIDHRRSYDLSFVFKTKNGKKLKGKPTWLHSVKTDKKGTNGKPTKKLNEFTKVDGVWTMRFTPGYHYEGQYRKFGVIAPNGKRYYFVIYVK